MPSSLNAHLFSEPRRRPIFWLHLALGAVIVLASVARFVVESALLPSPTMIPLGIALICLGAAEQLPPRSIRFAGALRIGYYLALLTYGGLLVVAPMLSLPTAEAWYWAFIVALVAGSAITVWAAWQFWIANQSPT